MTRRKQIEIEATAGFRTALFDGCLVPNSPNHMATEHFYYAMDGDFIELCDTDYLFAVATFAEEWEDKYIYTYDYKQDSNWLVYQQDLRPDSYSQKRYTFKQNGYFRICIKRIDGRSVLEEDAGRINDILHFYGTLREFRAKKCFEPEIEKTIKETKEARQRDELTFCLLSDSHYTVNGTWEDTADNMKKVLKEVMVNGIIHLGDFTDGMTSKKITCDYMNRMKKEMLSNNVPLYITLGNHDSNYFKGNREPLTIKDQVDLFEMDSPYYFYDFDEYKVRCLFLCSYDTDTPVRYGFTEKEVEWVKKVLVETKAGYKVIIFSHEAPLPQLDYWARLIRNGDYLMKVLEDYNSQDNRQILAYIHGHTHAEHVYNGSSFPIISIGCNKCEYYPDKKPKGSIAYMRTVGTISQDLWDMLVVKPEEEKLEFIRFGAGENRTIDCRKSISTWKTEEENNRLSRTTKIWAHRGSSGFAPENTLPAFQVAKDLHIDGIELDVHMTKDGELVVIHDEKIDRVSDGQGYVKDYTLAELKEFNFAKTKPAFGFVQIPTLQEVYQMFQGTDYMINVELKTNVIDYGGCFEEKVHQLTEQMRMTKQIIYSSFNHSSIIKMQQFITKEKTAFLYVDGMIDVTDYGKKYQVDALHPANYDVKCKKYVEECHEKNLTVNVWNVNDKEEAVRLKKLGVDAVITNHPGKMKEWIS